MHQHSARDRRGGKQRGRLPNLSSWRFVCGKISLPHLRRHGWILTAGGYLKYKTQVRSNPPHSSLFTPPPIFVADSSPTFHENCRKKTLLGSLPNVDIQRDTQIIHIPVNLAGRAETSHPIRTVPVSPLAFPALFCGRSEALSNAPVREGRSMCCNSLYEAYAT